MINSKSKFRALIFSLFPLLILFILWWFAGRWYEARLIDEKRAEVSSVMHANGNSLTNAINRRMALISGLKAFILTENDFRNTLSRDIFDKFAAGLYVSTKGIRAIQALPGGVVRFVYPIVGNEQTLGHDLLHDSRPAVSEDVQRTIRTREIALSNPYELRQGGLGVVGRLAVYKSDDALWGLAVIVLDIPLLLDAAGITLPESKIELSLRDKSNKVFYGREEVFTSGPVIARIELPDGYWELAGIPKEGWGLSIQGSLILFRGVSLTFVLMLSGIVYLTASRQASLTMAVRQRTAELNLELFERKRTEEAVQQSHERLRRFVDANIVGVVIAGPSGNIIEANDYYLRMIGYTREEFEQNMINWLAITPPEWLTADEHAIAELRKRGTCTPYEKEYVRRDGTRVAVFLSDAMLPGPEEQIAAFVLDITDRKKTEAERQLFVSLANNSKEFIGIADLNFIPFYANAAALKLVGLPDLDAVRKIKVQDVFFPEDQTFITNEFLPRVLREGNSEVEIRFRHFQTGEATWMLYNVFAIHDMRGELAGWATVSRDINKRKMAEEELRITNEELLAINRIVTTTTTTTTGVKEILEKVMDEALNITGLEGGTICMVTPDETLHLAAHRETSEATIFDLTTNEIKIGECLCGECAQDHKPLILRDREAVLKFATREATRGEDIRFHAAFPLIIGDRCLGVLCVFTRSDKKPTERSLKLLETVTSQIAIAVDNARMFEEISHHAAILENKVNERTAELKESQIALIGIVEDLNQKSEELRVANERLKELDRLKSMFIASMSHELRTPLNSVIGFSSVLLNEWAGHVNDEQKQLLSTISRSGKHLLSLINDVIDVSKIEAGAIDVHPEEFDLYDLIAEVVDLLKKDIAEKQLELKIASIHLTINTDRRRLFQSVLNLVSNAVKFTLKGTVSISARKGVGDLGVVVSERQPIPGNQSLIPDGNFAEISVEDTGIGIKEEDIPRLFKSFVRLDSPLRTTVLGTGLGLYLTEKLVTEILKGDIFVESIYGEGSKFAIRVPVKISEYQSS